MANLEGFEFRLEHESFDTDGPIHQGGWIEAEVTVLRTGEKIGTARIGAWVHTKYAAHLDEAIHNECVEKGYAIRPFTDGSRKFVAVSPAAGTLLAEGDILDAAYAQMHPVQVWHCALKKWMRVATEQKSVEDLLDYIAAIAIYVAAATKA